MSRTTENCGILKELITFKILQNYCMCRARGNYRIFEGIYNDHTTTKILLIQIGGKYTIFIGILKHQLILPFYRITTHAGCYVRLHLGSLQRRCIRALDWDFSYPPQTPLHPPTLGDFGVHIAACGWGSKRCCRNYSYHLQINKFDICMMKGCFVF